MIDASLNSVSMSFEWCLTECLLHEWKLAKQKHNEWVGRDVSVSLLLLCVCIIIMSIIDCVCVAQGQAPGQGWVRLRWNVVSYCLQITWQFL